LLAELAAFIHVAGQINGDCITLHSEHAIVARKYVQLLYDIFQIESEIKNDRHLYFVTVNGSIQINRVLKATHNTRVAMGQCCKRAYIRGVFIAAGTMSDPVKTYHLEFSMSLRTEIPLGMAQEIFDMLCTFGLRPKIMQRKAYTIVYLKEAENIVDLLNIMEAHKSLLQLENVRILKEMRNSVNRKVNFETANLSKTVNAAVQQVEDIQYIAEHVGLGFLSGPLEEVARLRLSYDAASLKEIGAMLSPPVGKSGVNHRLRKISEIAEKLKEDL